MLELMPETRLYCETVKNGNQYYDLIIFSNISFTLNSYNEAEVLIKNLQPHHRVARQTNSRPSKPCDTARQ